MRELINYTRGIGLTRKKTHVLMLTIVLAGCGKKMTTPEDDNSTRRDYLEAKTITLNALSQDGYHENESYRYSEQGFVNIAPEIEIINGQTLMDWKIKLDFNLYNNQTDIYCYYTPDIINQGKAIFQTCYIPDIDNDGVDDEINYYPGDEYEIDKNHVIKMSIMRGMGTASGPIQVMGQFDIRWY